MHANFSLTVACAAANMPNAPSGALTTINPAIAQTIRRMRDLAIKTGQGAEAMPCTLPVWFTAHDRRHIDADVDAVELVVSKDDFYWRGTLPGSMQTIETERLRIDQLPLYDALPNETDCFMSAEDIVTLCSSFRYTFQTWAPDCYGFICDGGVSLEFKSREEAIAAAYRKLKDEYGTNVPVAARAVALDGRSNVHFDCSSWLEQADDDSLRIIDSIDWGGDAEANAIVEHYAKTNDELADMLAASNDQTSPRPFECYVYCAAALVWLKHRRPHILAEISWRHLTL